MAPAAPKNLFPLPLTAFEQFMLADESADYPMVFYLQVRLIGVVDRDVMRLAVDDALGRHPLLCSRVEERGGECCWVWDGDQIPEANWDRVSWGNQAPWQQSIDLRTGIGLRVWGEQLADNATVTLQFHHACCDGIGAARFLEDVAIAYAQHYAYSSGQESVVTELRPVNLESLKMRGSRDGRRIADIRGSLLRRMRILLKYTTRYLRQQKIALLSQPPESSSDRQAGLGLLTLQLDRQHTRALRDVAKTHSSSLNDLLVRDLMLTVQEWNSRNSKAKQRVSRWKQPTVCVLVPTSLRGPEDIELPACNVVSYVFMARPVALTSDPQRLLRTIRDEMQLVHQYQAGWLFVQALEVMQKIPGLLRLVMRRTRNSCMSTTVLSHMGNLLNAIGSRLPQTDGRIQMGNLLVQDIAGIPPIRKGTTAAFSTMLINGRLSISIRCCPDRFSKCEASKLLTAFSTCLASTAASKVLPRSTTSD